MARKSGTIKRFTTNRDGEEIGWLQTDDGVESQFDVGSARAKGLKEGDRVEYEDANLPGTVGRRMVKGLDKVASDAAVEDSTTNPGT